MRLRWVWLLFASYFFYICQGGVLYLTFILVIVSILTYIFGVLIHSSKNENVKKRWLITGIASVLVQLLWLKYLPFFVANLNSLLNGLAIPLRIPVPNLLISIGVSYFVFQAISYLADIYLEELEPERHIGRFFLSMSFFPKLLQGPIERGGSILSQLENLSRPSKENIIAGVNLFLWGAFKKIVIADQLSTFVDPVYNNVTSYSGFPLIIATYLYAFQIFFDFSGYTDMALGLARFFNIRLTQNFNAPYLSKSVPEFWRRWHISFSTWILDYIFKPLQFRFRSWTYWGTSLSLFITFLISGLWHGASWHYVAWGSAHGIFLSFSVLTSKYRKDIVKKLNIPTNILNYCRVFMTFNFVCIAWIFFRAKDMSDALYIVVNSIQGLIGSIYLIDIWANIFSDGRLVVTILLILIVATSDTIDRKLNCNKDFCEKLCWLNCVPLWVKSCFYSIIFYLIAFHGADTQSFIYLNF